MLDNVEYMVGMSIRPTSWYVTNTRFHKLHTDLVATPDQSQGHLSSLYKLLPQSNIHLFKNALNLYCYSLKISLLTFNQQQPYSLPQINCVHRAHEKLRYVTKKNTKILKFTFKALNLHLHHGACITSSFYSQRHI